MTNDEREWNFDCIMTAQAQISSVQDDMMRVLNGQANGVIRTRMCRQLRNVSEQLKTLVVTK